MIVSGEEEDYKRVLRRGCIILIEYMDPVPVVDIMQQEEFLKFSESRDIYEMPFTTEKNRSVVDKVRRKGYNGYTSFKRFLTMSNQIILVDYLEKVENDKETVSVIEALRQGRGITNSWNGVKDELIQLYKDFYVKTELSPLKPGIEVHVDDLYVPLQMEVMSTLQNCEDFLKDKFASLPPKKNRRKEVISFRDMLFDDDHQLLNTVFISADPGVGKTTFCRRLISLWCNTHTDRQHVQNDSPVVTGCECKTNATIVQQTEANSEGQIERENAETLKLFDFIFFVSLRHTSNEIMIEDMITNQLRIDNCVVNSILGSSELKCLIILDGLDEWSAPANTKYSPCEIKGFPKTHHLNKCHILVTTRPWKLLSVSHVKTHRHKDIDIVDMKQYNSDELIRLFLIQLVKKEKLDKTLNKFKNEIQEKGLCSLSATPLILKLLLCLWLEYGQLKTSVCHIYGTVTHLLIEYGLRKNEEDVTCKSKFDQITSNTKLVCKFFHKTDLKNINRFADILLQLAHLSFDSLVSGKENTKLIFRDLDLKQYDLDLELCSKLGILSQRPVIGKSLLYRERTVAFLHKSFQEFYAAMYISQYPQECMRRIKEIGNNVEKILEFSNVFQFVGEICPNIIADLSDHISLVDHDSSYTDSDDIRRKISRLILSIGKESLNSNFKDLSITLNYLYLSNSETEYLQLLASICLEKLRGIDLEKISVSCTQITRLLTRPSNLTRVKLYGIDINGNNRTPVHVISNVKHLNVISSEIFVHVPIYPSLQHVYLGSLTLTHTQMCHLFCDSPSLKKVELMVVNCIEDRNCGCLVSAQRTTNRYLMSRICGCLASKDRTRSSLFDVSYAETLTVTFGVGMLNHIQKYHSLQDITLWSIQLSHSQILHLLTDSPCLRNIVLKDINCVADTMCGCIPSGGKNATKYAPSSMMNCSTQLGCEIFKHIHIYPRLSELNIVCIELTHLEITNLLSESPHLRNVRLSEVKCDPVEECGCLPTSHTESKNIASNYRRSSSSLRHSLHLAVEKRSSLVQVCTILAGSGIFDHISTFQQLQELHIETTDLTHAQITCLLTTSRNLKNVRLYGVCCKIDDECGCPTDLHCRTFSAEMCTIEGGTEMFAHVDKCPNLKELKLHYVGMSYTKFTDLLTQSPCLRELSLAGLENMTDIEYDDIYSSPDNTNFDQFLQDRILRVLRRLPKIDGLLIKLEDIEISPEPIVNEMQQIEHIEYVKTIKVRCIESHGFHDNNVEIETPIRCTILLKVKARDLHDSF